MILLFLDNIIECADLIIIVWYTTQAEPLHETQLKFIRDIGSGAGDTEEDSPVPNNNYMKWSDVNIWHLIV